MVSDICGRARNSYSKGVLKKDFKDGLLEMEETAADVDLDARGERRRSFDCLSSPARLQQHHASCRNEFHHHQVRLLQLRNTDW